MFFFTESHFVYRWRRINASCFFFFLLLLVLLLLSLWRYVMIYINIDLCISCVSKPAVCNICWFIDSESPQQRHQRHTRVGSSGSSCKETVVCNVWRAILMRLFGFYGSCHILCYMYSFFPFLWVVHILLFKLSFYVNGLVWFSSSNIVLL